MCEPWASFGVPSRSSLFPSRHRSSIIYHGPVGEAVPFFGTLGLSCPPRKDVPSFLIEITTPSGQKEFATTDLEERVSSSGRPAPAEPKRRAVLSSGEWLVPIADMVSAFRSGTAAGRAMEAALASPFDK